jgi:single-stranded-DNA-specific exonuclease
VQFVPKYLPADEARVNALVRALNLSPLMAYILVSRGVDTPDRALLFLRGDLSHLHDPFLMRDMDRAVSAIRAALCAQEKIAVFGDYDVDGTCAAALMTMGLEALGGRVTCYIPDRLGEGYGLNAQAVRDLAERGVRLLVTVDCGVTAVEEVALARELGMAVVVTDHHQCPDRLPACEALLNPHREGERYPDSDLCGCGVAAKLLQALGGVEAVKPYLDLVALATIADLVPLTGENRILTRAGLEKLNEDPLVGLAALKQVAGYGGKRVEAGQVAFSLAPRINAGGRMGDAARAVRLYRAASLEEALPIAEDLDRENARRQRQEAEMVEQAAAAIEAGDALLEHRVLIASGEGWNRGVVGIVASRLVERYHRPALVFAREGDTLNGSGRSIPGVNLYEMLSACQLDLDRFGGHAMAAGLALKVDRLADFQAALDAHCRERYPAEVFAPKASYDAVLPLSEATPLLVEQLSQLSPTGMGNPQPVFLVEGAVVDNRAPMGATGAHLRGTVRCGRAYQQAVGFSMADQFAAYGEQDLLDLLVAPQMDTWQGVSRLKLYLKGARPSLAGHAARFLGEEAGERLLTGLYSQLIYSRGYDALPGNVTLLQDADALDFQVADALERDVSGTLIAVSTPQGAARLTALLQASGLAERVSWSWGQPGDRLGYNGVVAALPGRGAPLRCRRLILYDGALESAYAAALAGRAPEVLVAASSREQEVLRQALARMDVRRELLLSCHRALKAICPVQAPSLEALYPLIRPACPGLRRYQLALALPVFRELGLVAYPDEPPYEVAMRNPGKTQSLLDSRIYRNLVRPRGAEPVSDAEQEVGA